MCPEAGTLSPAMRNRAVEIRLSDDEHILRSTPDKIRLLGGGELEMQMVATAGQPELDAVLDLDMGDLMRIRSFTAADREKLLGLAVSDANAETPANQSLVTQRPARAVEVPNETATLAKFLSAHYADAWLYYLRQSDPAIVFFYARIAGGVDQSLASKIAASEGRCIQTLV